MRLRLDKAHAGMFARHLAELALWWDTYVSSQQKWPAEASLSWAGGRLFTEAAHGMCAVCVGMLWRECEARFCSMTCGPAASCGQLGSCQVRPDRVIHVKLYLGPIARCGADGHFW